MIQTIRKALGIPELRKKIIFTVLILLIFRIGNAITVPFVDVELLKAYLQSTGGSILNLYDVMSGGAFANATVFALSIQPYINSSIIIQLLTVAIPALERLAKDGGEEGRKKIQAITRYTTVGIAILQAVGYYMMMKNFNLLESGATGIWPALVIIVTFIAGSSFVMWMGEQVTEFGVGNGISIILFAGILSRVPTMVSSMYKGVMNWSNGAVATEENNILVLHPAALLLILVGMLALVVFIQHSGAAPGRAAADSGRHAGPGGVHRVYQRCRAPHPRPVCQAAGWPEDVWRPEHPSAHEGEYVRRAACHLRPEHCVSAHHRVELHRYSQRQGVRLLRYLQRH